MTLASILYQVSGGSTPTPVDPGNDPILTLLATVAFIGFSLAVGVIGFKRRLRRMGYDATLLKPTVITGPKSPVSATVSRPPDSSNRK